eukprot:7215569-Alexandrium_andersonii.AAC.1
MCYAFKSTVSSRNSIAPSGAGCLKGGTCTSVRQTLRLIDPRAEWRCSRPRVAERRRSKFGLG